MLLVQTAGIKPELPAIRGYLEGLNCQDMGV
jgi:hypothetical protein